MGYDVDLDVADAKRRTTQRVSVQLSASPDRPQPADQLRHRERLTDVIIRTCLKTENAVCRRIARGHDHDRHRAGSTDQSATLNPTQATNVDVEDNQFVVIVDRALERNLAVGALVDRESLQTQRVAERGQGRRVVVGYQDAARTLAPCDVHSLIRLAARTGTEELGHNPGTGPLGGDSRAASERFQCG